jgi:hypothetical protein
VETHARHVRYNYRNAPHHRHQEVTGTRRERIEAAAVIVGEQSSGPHEAWIATDPFEGGFRVLITGPQGFDRTVVFALDDDSAEIADSVMTQIYC